MWDTDSSLKIFYKPKTPTSYNRKINNKYNTPYNNRAMQPF